MHNLNYDLQYAILEDVYGTDTWLAIQAAGEACSDVVSRRVGHVPPGEG